MGIATEQELNRKLAKWAGNFDVHYNDYLYKWRWQAPDGEWDIDFTSSLDACFKWLVPEFRLEYDEEALLKLLTEWVDEVALHISDIKKAAFYLCRAIEKMIDNEDTGG